MRTVTVNADYLEHLLNCLANQKFLHEMGPEDRASGQVAIDSAWKNGMELLASRSDAVPRRPVYDNVYPQPDFKHHYVVGFAFDHTRKYVVLIHKNRPAWQSGLLNGVGGKIETDSAIGETPLDAMRREFREEAGVDDAGWVKFCELWSGNTIIHFFTTTLSLDQEKAVTTMTDEGVSWYSFSRVHDYRCVSNLVWLIPMALGEPVSATVVEGKA